MKEIKDSYSVVEALEKYNYVADEELATSLFLLFGCRNMSCGTIVHHGISVYSK